MRKFPRICKDTAHEYREKIIEAAAESDEKVMEKFVGGEPVSNEELKAAVRKGTIAMKMTPVLCGSAFKNKGVQQLAGCRRRLSAVAGRYSSD